MPRHAVILTAGQQGHTLATGKSHKANVTEGIKTLLCATVTEEC